MKLLIYSSNTMWAVTINCKSICLALAGKQRPPYATIATKLFLHMYNGIVNQARQLQTSMHLVS